jgi:hypothetical protein
MKLNQAIAIEKSTKKLEYADLSKDHHILQKHDLFNGFNRTFSARHEDGVTYPDEKKVIQQDVTNIIKNAASHLADLFNITATKDVGNCSAVADIVVDGKIIAAKVPVTYLLFLEKQLTDIRTFVSKLPTLDPSKRWTYDSNAGYWKTDADVKIKSRKVQQPLVLVPATDKHPAQAQIISVDEVEGTWNQVDISTSYPVDTIKMLLEKISKLDKAVKIAREEANSLEVQKQNFGSSIIDFIFGG